MLIHQQKSQTTLRDEELRTVFEHLNDKILKLTQRISRIKNMDAVQNKEHHSAQCTMVCESLSGDKRTICLQDCQTLPLDKPEAEDYHEYTPRFPDRKSVV